MQALAAAPGTAAAAAAAAPPAERGPAALLARLPAMPRFLARRALLFSLLGLAIITAPLYWGVQHNFNIAVGFMGLVLILGFESSIYFRIVVQSAYGEEEISPPDISDLHSDLIGPAFRYIAALVPIILGVVWYADQAFGSVWIGVIVFRADPLGILDYPGPTLLVVGGVVLLPLLTVIAAMSESFFAVLNPATWVNALRILSVTYLVGAVAFYAILAFEVFVWSDVLVWIAAHLDVPLLTRVLILFLGYLPFALRARLMGAVVEPYLSDSAAL